MLGLLCLGLGTHLQVRGRNWAGRKPLDFVGGTLKSAELVHLLAWNGGS